MSDTASQHIGHVDALNLTVSLCLCYTLCIALVRLWIRRGAFGVDDLVVLMATLITLGHTGSSYAALANGLGKPWKTVQAEGSVTELNAASIAGVVTFIIALYISKIGVLAFLSRITKSRHQVLAYYACCALVAAFGVMSVLIVTVDCPSPPGYYWAFFANRGSCPSQSVRWQVVTALDVITELGLLVLPIQLVWALQMSWTKKAILIVAFYLRLPVIGLSIGRNTYTLRLHNAASDPGLDSTIVTIWLEVQLTYALAASTLSALKAFTESFNSGFGLAFTRGKSESGSYALSRMSSSGNNGGASQTSASQTRSDKRKSLTTATTSLTSPDLKAIKYEDTIRRSEPRPTSAASKTSSTRPLRLRPDLTSRATAIATASASASSETSPWRCTGGGCSSSSISEIESEREGERERGEGLVIMRETELSVRNDPAPGMEGSSRRAGEMV